MPDWILLPPIFFPLVTAITYLLAARRIPDRVRLWLPVAFVSLEIALILVTIAPGSHTLLLSSWNLASFSLALQIDGVTLLLLLTMFLPLMGLWLIDPRRAPLAPIPIMMLTSAMLLASAANLATVLLAWAFLDVTIFAWRLAADIERQTALRTLAVSQLAGLVLFAGAILLGVSQPGMGAFWVGLAFWARLALFPFQWTLVSHGQDTFDLWISRGIPLLAAANLWLHWPSQVDVPITLIGVLVVAANIASAIWIWREEQPSRAVNVAVSQALAFVPLAIAFGGDAGLALGLWLTLSTVLSFSLFEAAQRWRSENRSRYPRLIWFGGLLSLTGLPLTPGFLARIGLYVILAESGQWLLLAVASVTTLLVLAPLWETGFALRGAESRESTRLELGGLLVFVLTLAALSLAPMLIAHALSPSAGDSAELVLDRVIRTNDLAGVVVAIVLSYLPVLGSYWIRNAAHRLHPRSGSLIARLERLLDLQWLESPMKGLGYQMGAIARSVSTIEEENPTVWILLAGLWVAIFVSVLR